MSRSSTWLNPTTVQAAIALAIAAALANGVWIFLDDSVPSWDQAHYLSITLQYQQALDAGGPIDLLRSIRASDPSHGPLFTVLMLPFVYVFGPAARSGLLMNLALAPVLFFAAGQIAWIVFRSWIARLLTILLVATMPLMVGLMHNVLQDFLLVTLATVSLLLLLQTELFQRRGMSLAMGLAMGLGTLTKVTFPLFVAGPLLVVAAQVFVSSRSSRANASGPGFDLRALGKNLALAGLVYLIVVAAWYGPNFSATLDYVQSTTSGPLALGAGPSNPYTFHAVTSFTTGVVNFNLSWVILLTGLVAVGLSLPAIRALFRRPLRAEPLLRLAFVLAWVLIPYLSVALAKNQDVRLMAPALPGAAVLVAGAVSVIRWPRARFALAAVAVTVLGYQTLNHITDVTPGFMPEKASVRIDSYEALIQLDSATIGYEQLPGPDYATPVMEHIESVAGDQEGGADAPRMICMLQSEAVVNSNTFRFFTSAREDPYQFADVVAGPGGEKELKAVLGGCDFALYVPQPPKDPSDESRLALVNEPYAANYMTPRLLALFEGPRRAFPIADGDHVQVLAREPAS